jgi:predicted amidohydrolase YtcJ
MDGSGGARTAWMSPDWNKNSSGTDTGNTGYPTWIPRSIADGPTLPPGRRHVGTHAIGDRAIDWVVDTYAEVLDETPTPGLRHSIIHANIASDHAIHVMAALQAKYDAGYPEAQAPFHVVDRRYLCRQFRSGAFSASGAPEDLPDERRALGRRLRLSGHSHRGALRSLGLGGARNPEGTYGAHPFGSAESVDIHTALRSYTSWAAHQLFLDKQIGSLEVGKDADIAVWDRDMYKVPPGELKALTCMLTLVHGAVVYQVAAH